MTTPVIEFEAARITQRSSDDVTLGPSVAVLTETAAATTTDSPDVHYYIAPHALDGAAYPSLVAVWDNEQDAIFDAIRARNRRRRTDSLL